MDLKSKLKIIGIHIVYYLESRVKKKTTNFAPGTELVNGGEGANRQTKEGMPTERGCVSGDETGINTGR